MRSVVLALIVALCASISACKEEEKPRGTPQPPPPAVVDPLTEADQEKRNARRKMPHARGELPPIKPKKESPEAAAAKLERERARTRKAVDRIASKVRAYHAAQTPPALPATLWDLIEPPADQEPYLNNRVIRDAWGNDVSYIRHDALRFTLVSVGPDNSYGGGDDLSVDFRVSGAAPPPSPPQPASK